MAGNSSEELTASGLDLVDPRVRARELLEKSLDPRMLSTPGIG